MPPKKKQNILDDVLTGPEENSYPGMDELNALIQGSGKARPKTKVRKKSTGTRTKAATPIRKQSTGAQTKVSKKKATHYLAVATFEDLNQSIPKIKKMLPEDLQNSVSKSQLVDSSLKLLLEEFQKKGKDSLLVQQLLKEKGGA